MKVNYYWYHHGLAWNPHGTNYYNDYKRIQLFLDGHDYERFMEMKAEYPDCLPHMASVYDENGDIVENVGPESESELKVNDCLLSSTSLKENTFEKTAVPLKLPSDFAGIKDTFGDKKD